MENIKKNKDFLWLILFLIVFINGFEAGGYQASLWNIGQNYKLSVTFMGIFASVELFATMLAPLVLGNWADRSGKGHCIKILLGIQIFAAVAILFTNAGEFFVIGVFFLGLTTSALQFISIATLADTYPLSGSKKIGYITSMYALGALIAPLVVDFYLNHGMHWRTLFALLAVGSVIGFIGIFKSGDDVREIVADEDTSSGDVNKSKGSEFIIIGVLLLCVIMCIYVGFENGFTFFVDTLFTDVLKASTGKFALSLFWAVMIPSRVLVGHFAKHAKKILVASIVTIPIITVLISLSNNSTVVMLLCVPLGFASGAIYPSVLNIMLFFAGKKTATATGMITTATGIGGVVFTALTGFLGDTLGMRMAMACLSGFFIISFIAALFSIKMIKNYSFNSK
ncbi:MFS transporter [Butyrivibrio sp. YAB3001]|uniref:MFS transporter n=1 Tax=Butyrivibrio sp. YAB3001 TaxID=1520812 RepID=UPI0008F62A4C|nr:MFS transporter [Butyrivibrio sp. YAB3001]SFD02396.1 Fucose permease [Butyrivibrio sp. YAB3001]